VILTNLINDLPDDQQLAIRDYERCVMIAGPGSGKTHRLILKVAYLLGQEMILPQEIACITYMNDAVRGIEERLSELGFEDDDRLFVGTVHKFCITAIILPFKNVFLKELPDELRIASNEQQLRLLSELVNKPEKDCKDVLRRINELRRDELFYEFNNHKRKKISDISRKYISSLRDNNLIDFEDIAIESARLVMQESEVRDYLSAKYPWLIIDEYQDLGKVFNILITKLIKNTDINFFIVGDKNQSIMGFQGATPSYLSELSDMPNSHPVPIIITRRCLPHIVQIANKLLPNGESELTTIHKKQKREVRSYDCPSGKDEQISQVVTEIDRLNELEIKYGEIAILCRNQSLVKNIITRLEDEKIPYYGRSDGRYPRKPLTRWLEDIASWQRTGWQDGKPKFQRIYRDYRRFLEYHEMLSFNMPEELERRSKFFHALWELRDTREFAHVWLYQLVKRLNLDLIVESIGNVEPDNADAFWELSEAIQQDKHLGNLTVADLALCGRPENSVFVSTLHSSKGLEFDAVILPFLEQGILPDFRSTTEDKVAEERRLMYVGITRARKEVSLLYSGFYYNRWGRKFTNGRSQFLDELGL
jgi:DNA helicase II / ATP-dependent DNA helicase PcrA